MKKSRIRDTSVDFSRGIAMVIVVMGHAGALISVLDLFGMFIQSFQMPLFMLISGYCTGFSFPIVDRFTFIKKKVKNLLIPYFCWIIIRMLILILHKDMIFNLPTVLNEIFNSGFWFLRELFYLNVALAVLSIAYERIFGCYVEIGIKGIIVFVIVVISELIALYFVSELPGCYNLWKHYLFFLLGLMLYYALKRQVLADALIKLSVGAFGGFLVAFWIMYYMPDTLWGKLADVIAALCGSISIFLLTKYFASRKRILVVEEIGKRTLGIYAVHWIFLFSLELGDWEKQLWFLRNPYIILIVLSSLWIAISYFAVLLLEKVPILRRLFLGT